MFSTPEIGDQNRGTGCLFPVLITLAYLVLQLICISWVDPEDYSWL